MQSSITNPFPVPLRFRALELQFALVCFQEGLQRLCLTEQAVPLLVVKRDGKATQAIDAYGALFADLELQRAGAPAATLAFQFSKPCLQLFITRFISHSSALLRKEIVLMNVRRASRALHASSRSSCRLRVLLDDVAQSVCHVGLARQMR